jgi:hypothetical protein
LRFALAKDIQVMIAQSEKLNCMAYEAARETTNNHGGNVDSSGYFDTKSDNGQAGFYDESNEEDLEDVWYMLSGWTKTVPGIGVCVAWAG